MKTYSKLQLPPDTAWDRNTWRNYTHWKIREVIDGVHNIIRWIPIIYKDKDWDDYYTLRLIQKKIEYQRKYLVKHNRHTRVDEDNFWMTVVLNLIEREIEEYYSMEQYDYKESHFTFAPTEDNKSFTVDVKCEWEKLDDYLVKYPSTVRKVKILYPKEDFTDIDRLSFYVGKHNQDKCRNLLFDILKRYSNRWWD